MQIRRRRRLCPLLNVNMCLFFFQGESERLQGRKENRQTKRTVVLHVEINSI